MRRERSREETTAEEGLNKQSDGRRSHRERKPTISYTLCNSQMGKVGVGGDLARH